MPIVDALLPILYAGRGQASTELVFPNWAGNMHRESARIFQETLHRVLDRAGFAPGVGAVEALHPLPFVAAHVRIRWRLNGGPVDDLIRVLGHTSKAMTDHYSNIGGYHRPAHFALFA